MAKPGEESTVAPEKVERSGFSRRGRITYFTRSSVRDTPYPEIALPALARDGWNISIFAPDADQSVLRQVLPFPCHQSPLSSDGATAGWRAELALFRKLLAARLGAADILYINSQSLSARAAVALAGPKFGKRIVYHNPDYYDPIAHPWHFRLERRLCRKADLYMNNEFHRGYITQTMYGLRCQVITTPPNLPAAWPVPARSESRRAEIAGGQPDAFVLMLHGSYAESRMVPQLFEALALLPPRFRLVMTGANHRKNEVDAALQKLGLANRVIRLPRVGFLELFEYTVNADAGVLLYQNNDLGNFFTAPGRITEYMACGLPVLGTNHTGLENLILRYDLGETVDSTTPASIADGIRRLEQRINRGMLTRTRMREQFLRHFAFDHWEPAVVEAFRALDSGVRSLLESRPRYPWLPQP